MSNLYNHTYWDGMTTERHTSRRPYRSHDYNEPEPAPQIHGPHKPLSEALKMLAYEQQLRREQS